MFPLRIISPKYRPNVAVLVTDGQGRVLLCYRPQPDGSTAAQTVQGGIDPGETAEQALVREVYEEIGLKPGQYRIVKHSEARYRYDWPKEFVELKHSVFVGQEQQFYLIQVDPSVEFDLDLHHREFSYVEWGKPEEMVQKCWSQKRPGLEGALREFGLLSDDVQRAVV